jgi:hypothetical protein
MIIERDADDVARCFALERLLHEHGYQAAFAGEITGLISAGAFLAFDEHHDAAPRFQGMLPVRLLRAPAPADAPAAASGASGNARRGSREDGRRGRDGGRGREPDGGREWWELNEQGTILHGERTGATLRLGDSLDVRISRVDSIRGRVDLTPPP